MLTMTTTARAFQFFILGPTIPDTAVKLKWSKEGVGLISLDPHAFVVDDPFDPARGQRSLISGAIRPGAVGTSDVTATLVDWNNNDAPLGTAVDTITVVEPSEGVPEWSGSFFGGSLALTASATKAK